MNPPVMRFRLIFPFLLYLLAPAAIAQADCGADIALIEKRLSTGKYPASSIDGARQIQAVLKQMCPYMIESQLAGMRDAINNLLPVPEEEAPPTPQALLAPATANKRLARFYPKLMDCWNDSNLATALRDRILRPPAREQHQATGAYLDHPGLASRR